MHDQLALQSDDPELRYGFSYGHVRALARRALRDHRPSRGMDPEDRFEAAWGAIVEHLYATSVPPTSLDLIIAGRNGLSRMRKRSLSERGYAYRENGSGRDPAAGAMSAPSFWRYWHKPTPPTPEDIAVDRIALWQIMAELTPVQSQTLLGLAEYGDRELAAKALGVTDRTFQKRLLAARAAFFVLWHEHEAPTGMWRNSFRASRLNPRSRPASHQDAIKSLCDVAKCFGDRTRIASADLLVSLLAVDCDRYGDWDLKDLGSLLRRYGVGRHKINIDGDRRNKRWGLWLEEVTSAIAELTTSGTPAASSAA